MHSELHPESRPRRRLSPAEVEALVTWRVAQLEVLAARTALGYAKMKTREAQMKTREAFKDLGIDIDD